MNYLKCQYFSFISVLCCIVALDILHMCMCSLKYCCLVFLLGFFCKHVLFPHAGSNINSSDLAIYNIVSSDAVLLEYGM